MGDPATIIPESASEQIEALRAAALEHLVDVAEALFGDYGQALTRTSHEREERRRLQVSLGAALGFTSIYVRGVLAVAVEHDLAISMNPLPDGADRPGAAADWIGEVANQLLGRLKNKLLKHGVDLALSTPFVVEGTDLQIGAKGHSAVKLTFANEAHRAIVWWDMEVDPDLQLGETEGDEPQVEGDLLLF